jgi:malonyl-CoA O-methyltransferase
LALTRFKPRIVCDVGCGTGLVTLDLARRYRGVKLYASEMAPDLLALVRARAPWLRPWSCLCAYPDQLPLRDASCDLLFSNLALQWSNDVGSAMSEFSRVLRADGLLMFATLGPDTLWELRASWRSADECPHVHGFLDLHDLGDAMLRAGLRDPVTDVERLTLTYGDVKALLSDLKSLGATNALWGRRAGLTGKERLQAMISSYETHRCEGRIPATFEIVYGHAWGKSETGTRRNDAASGITEIPLEALVARLRRRRD